MTAVNRLREQLQALSRRPFLARGASVTRCKDCLLARAWCACHARPDPSRDCAVALVFYQGEIFKPSNSGRLIADCVADNHAFLWQRTEIHSDFQKLIHNPNYQPLIVFPHEYVVDNPVINHLDEYKTRAANKIPLFIFLDGTWREARKMFRSAWFDQLPVVSLFEAQHIQYQLRQSVHDFQFGTADVAIHLFKQLEFEQLSNNLASYADTMQQRYLAGKANHQPPDSKLRR